MDLASYLRKNKLTITQFAKICKLSRCHLSKVLNNILRPGLYTAARIFIATKGEVKYQEEFFECYTISESKSKKKPLSKPRGKTTLSRRS